ncbi:MAG: GrpB family protein [Deltaproteobacteria bacterium]|nr:GrpB family protein [Deltaproteobacteria bacterium]
MPKLPAREMIGLQRHTVRVVEHNPGWAALADEACRQVRAAGGDSIADVQHVGSTAVLGLPAKPIIDLVVGLQTMRVLESVKGALLTLGYLYRGIGADSLSHLFVLESAPDFRTEHLHVIPLGGTQWDSYIVFRDRLRSDRYLVKEYGRLKQRLRVCYPNDRKRYTAGKAAFILSVIGAQQGAAAKRRPRHRR